MNTLEETSRIEKKSIKFLKPKNTDWDELAKDCISFANAQGGFIYIGIEDDSSIPPVGQLLNDRNIPEKIQKAISERTINVGVAVSILKAENDAEYIRIRVLPSIQTIASTTDGRYYIRISDSCRSIPPDELARLAAEKNAFVWEE